MEDNKYTENPEDDFEFISAESVKDKRKMVKAADVDSSEADSRKTARRSMDSMEDEKEKKRNFMKSHKIVWFIIIVLIIAALAVAAHYLKQMKDQKAEENKELPYSTQEYEKDENQEINDLVAAYYDAYAQGDTEAILKYAYPMTENEKSYIEMYSTFIQEYQDIVCYTKTGLDDTSFIVSVAFDLKFKGINTTAPGLDFFYVRTAEDGSFYIDNTYSPYNLTYQENDLDPEIVQLITDYQAGDDVTALLAGVQVQYEDAVSSDSALEELVDVTIPDAVAQWKTQIDEAEAAAQEAAAQQVQEDTAAEEAPAEEAPAEEAPAEEAPAEEEAPADTGVTETESRAWVYVTETVNIRETPDENGTVVASAIKGSEVRQTAVTDNGWSKIYTGDVEGYIRSDYISADPVN